MRLQSKSYQVADYLRRAIRQDRLSTPLAGLRVWSRELGVSRRTLADALHMLQREGLLTVFPRGARLNLDPPSAPRSVERSPRRVHWLIERAYRHQLHTPHEIFERLQQRFRLRGIALTLDVCAPARLREIARRPNKANELFLLGSLSPVYQRLFAFSGKPIVVLGNADPSVSVPQISADQAGAVRHAAFHLMRRGHTRLVFLHLQSAAIGLRRAKEAFAAACAEWPRGEINSQVISTELDPASLLSAMKRLCSRITGRTGVIVLSPVPLSMVTTALLQHGIAVPDKAETVALLHPRELIQLYPPPIHYEWPQSAIIRRITAVTDHYFSTGTLPVEQSEIAVEIARD